MLLLIELADLKPISTTVYGRLYGAVSLGLSVTESGKTLHVKYRTKSGADMPRHKTTTELRGELWARQHFNMQRHEDKLVNHDIRKQVDGRE